MVTVAISSAKKSSYHRPQKSLDDIIAYFAYLVLCNPDCRKKEYKCWQNKKWIKALILCLELQIKFMKHLMFDSINKL